MTLHDMLPKQSEIEEFLGKDFFPKYPNPQSLSETVDMVQIEFNVPDDARALPVPRGHASTYEGGTILECLTHFALLRLLERGFVVRTDRNTYAWKDGVRWFGKVSQKHLNHLVLQLHRGTSLGHTVSEIRDQWEKNGSWTPDEMQAAVHKFNLTKERSVLV